MAATWDPTAYIDTVTKRAQDQWGKSNDQYKWAQDQFAKNTGVTDTVVNRALNTGAQFGDWAATDRGDYEKNVRPAMQEQMDFARGYTTPERMAANRASAIGGANLASDAAGKNAKQVLMSYGADPSSGQFAGLEVAQQSARAKNAAAAGTRSDRDTEMLGQQYLSNAIKTGQVLPGQALAEAQQGSAQDSLAVNAALANTRLGDETMGNTTKWAGLGNDMIKEWLGGAKTAGELNLAQEKLDSASSSGLGTGLGMLASLGGKAASMYGSGGASGTIMNRRGGRIPRYRAGGPVGPQPRPRPEDQRGPPKPLAPPVEPDEQDDPNIPEWMRRGTPSPEAPDVPHFDVGGGVNVDLDNSEGPLFMPHRGDYDNSLNYIFQSIWGDGGKQAQQGESGGSGGGLLGGKGGGKVPGGGGSGGNGGVSPTGPQGSGPGGVYQVGDFPSIDDGSGIDNEIADWSSYFGGGGVERYVGGGGVGGYNIMEGEGIGGDMGGDMGGDVGPGEILSVGKDLYGTGNAIFNYQGEKDQPDTPYDPAAKLWQGIDNDKAKYDQGEQIGSGAGRVAGDVIGNIVTPGFGGVWAEGLSRVGAGVGAAVQGHWGEAGTDIIEGTPFDALFQASAKGGPIVDGPTSGVTNPNSVPPEASPSRGQNTDDVHAMVQVGEFVMPEDVSRWYGEKYFQGLIEKARRDMSMATAQPEHGPAPQAMAISPPSFRSEGARA